MNALNTNEFNFKFTHSFSSTQISYLDLTIRINDQSDLVTDLSRKPSSGNTILHASSLYPAPLIRSIPYAQYLQLRRNCTTDDNFFKQADHLQNRLLARAYSRSLLKKAFNKARLRSRLDLLYKSSVKPSVHKVKFVTRFSAHEPCLRASISCHWHLLAEDCTLSKYVHPTHELVFRRATSLRDTLTSSHYFITSDRSPRSTWGTYQCGRCSHCPWVTEGRGILLPNGQWHQSQCHTNCSTQGVIYLMTCKCHVFYIGKTICEFGQRIRDHVYSSGSGRMTTSVVRHIGLYHRFNNSVVSFFVLEVISPNPGGGDWDNMIFRAL